MLFNVPQYIDVEDKIAGPFTGKQLLWMFGMGAVLLVLWTTIDKTSFFVAAIFVVPIFVALAFWRPYGQPLIKFIYFSFAFMFRPKMYIWKRVAEKGKNANLKKERIPTVIKKQSVLTDSAMKSFAQMLDSEGRQHDAKVMDIMKSRMPHPKEKTKK
jgi:hypothetical protein